MILDVKPVRALQGVLDIPASKSYTIRAFFIAACGGSSRIIGPSDGDDALIAASVGKALKRGARIFHVGESGTTLRFLLPLLSFHIPRAVVKGKGTLIGRPNHHLCQTLRRQGMDIRGQGPQESVPIVYKGGLLEGGIIRINGTLSSQFISALMIALPRLGADSRIVVTGKQMVSGGYITMTRRILARAGIKVGAGFPRPHMDGPHTFFIPGNQKFKGLRNFRVPSDYGLAAFPLAAALLVPSKVVLKGNLEGDWPQSDGQIISLLKKMGGRFTDTARSIIVKGPSSLKGGVFNLKDCPDLVPVMAILGMFARGRTKLTGIGHARLKESDRLSDLRRELLKVGAKVSETRDVLVIDPRPSYKTGQILDPHHDHRLAMAFTVLGLRIGCKVKDIQSCAKSYPAFVKDIRKLGGLP